MESIELKRTKRRWQMGLRRYIIEQLPSEQYAPYFRFDCKRFREWIEIQFTDDLNWDNFGKKWQFDHVVPVAYFDFEKEEDLKLCWSFINIRVEKIDVDQNRGNRIDVIACKSYFQNLYAKTNFSLCKKMLDKIETLEVSNIDSNRAVEQYIIKNKELLETITTLSAEELAKLNTGTTVEDILLEREILRKFGGL